MFIHDAEGCGRGGGEQCGNRIFQYLTITTATPPYDDAIIVTTKRRRTSCDLAETDARQHGARAHLKTSFELKRT